MNFWQTAMAAPKISWASCPFGPQVPLQSEVVAVWPTAACLEHSRHPS